MYKSGKKLNNKFKIYEKLFFKNKFKEFNKY